MSTTTKDKDVEAGTPVYDQFGSPKVDDVQDGEPGAIRGASLPMLALISFPRLGLQMAWAAQWAALGPYLGTMMPKFAVQITQVIGPLSGILVGPTVGVLSDRSTHPWGRRRPFLLYGAIASVICWVLMSYARELGEACGDYGDGSEGVPTSRKWTAIFTVFFYTWMDVTVNVVQTPAYLLIADFAGDRQLTGAAYGQVWATIAAIVISGYIEFFGAAHLTLRYFLGMLAGVMIVSVGSVCIFVKETPLKENPDQESRLKRIGEAFYSIYKGLKLLPTVLAIYGLVFFFVVYGNTAYSGNKGQFFGFEVYDGNADNADTCGDSCTVAQANYNHGVKVAGGSTDLICNIVGIVYAYVLPLLVKKFGAKVVLSVMLIPQALLMVMAFCKVVAIDVFIVVIAGFSPGAVYAMLTPVIVHVFGDKSDIGMYVGALNSAGCFGQLLNFVVGAAVVETSMGYKLPVFIGGAMSFLGLLTCIFFFKIKMYSL